MFKVTTLALLLLSPLTALAGGHMDINKVDGCDGVFGYLRFSEVKPGQMDTFRQARDMHEKWYRDGGMRSNVQTVLEVFDIAEDRSTTKSTTQLVTLHINPPGDISEQRKKRGASWDAFVKKYQASSKVTDERAICLNRQFMESFGKFHH